MMSDFLKSQFDKLLLIVLVIFLSIYALHTAHHPTDAKLADWATKTSDLMTGALLTLITGGRLMQRRVDTDGGNGEPSSKTVTTVSTDQKAPTPTAAEPKKETP